jgi:hypothetical protein
MKIEIQTEQNLRISNYLAKIIQIDPEIPSAVTKITVEYLEGPLLGQTRILEIYN